MASINNIINALLLPPGRLAQEDNLNVCLLLTPETGVLNSAERYRSYTGLTAVQQDWGTGSAVASHARTFFGTRPNAVDAGGRFVVGYHRAAEEATAATAATLTGAPVDEPSLLLELQQITDGSFDIDVDATTVAATALNFQTATSLTAVATILDTAITGATVTFDGSRFMVVSDTTGALSTLSYATAGAAGTYVGELLGLADGLGATLTQGAAAGTLAAETQLDALAAIKAQVNFFGLVSVQPFDEPTDVAEWAVANSVMAYEVFSGTNALTVDVANDVWAIKLAGQTNFRCLYSKANNRRLATSYMARLHTVNFNAENSALTMNLKELNVPAEEYTQTEIDQAQTVGLDIYTTFKSNTPAVLCSGANGFADEPYNLIAYVDAIQTTAFNVLRGTATKVAQTTPGVNSLVAALEQRANSFARAGVIAPGTWTSTDRFGDRDTFDRNIEQTGYYFLAGRLSDQAPADREARLSPPIQNAIKLAGAIHKADIIINFNR